MHLFSTLDTLPGNARDCLLVIGNFDGVHRGHQALLAQARAKANAIGKKLAVLTFEPHPRKLFRPDDPPFRLSPPDIKAKRLKEENVDILFSLNFDWAFASQTAEDFIANILINGISPAHIMVGFDFRFGQLRKGSPDMLRAAGFEVTLFNEVTDENGEKFSSSAVRHALRHGDIDRANKLLGWEWYIEGVIQKGDQRGHELGYPTANVPLGDTLHPAYGVYATRVQIEGEEAWRPAATNIGIRPMFEVPVGQIEAYILDFPDTDIYGKTLKIQPVKRLRGEAKFTSLDALIAQIDDDVKETRRLLA